VIDIVEILNHWYSGRSQAAVARSLGVDRRTVKKYVSSAEKAGISPGGPPIGEEAWRAMVRGWFPQLYDTRLVRPTWDDIAKHHDYIADLVGIVPVSVIHQRLSDEAGLEVSVASLRRYVRARFTETCAGARSSSGARPWSPGTKPKWTTATSGPGETREAGATAGCGRSRWCSASPAICSSTRSW